jgi:hypothetical protein
LRILPALIIAGGSYWIIGLRAEVLPFLRYLFIMIVFSLTSGALGTAVAMVSRSTGSATVTTTVLLLVNSAFGGLMLNNATVPIYYRWAKYMSFWNYAYEALVSNELYDVVVYYNPKGMFIPTVGKSASAPAAAGALLLLPVSFLVSFFDYELTHACTIYTIMITGLSPAYVRGQAVMRELGLNAEMYSADVAALCVFAVVYSVLGALLLRFAVKEKR